MSDVPRKTYAEWSGSGTPQIVEYVKASEYDSLAASVRYVYAKLMPFTGDTSAPIEQVARTAASLLADRDRLAAELAALKIQAAVAVREKNAVCDELAQARAALEIADQHFSIIYPTGYACGDFVCVTVRNALSGISRSDNEQSAHGMIDDGFGNAWSKCGAACRIQVVRPGKVQCDCWYANE